MVQSDEKVVSQSPNANKKIIYLIPLFLTSFFNLRFISSLYTTSLSNLKSEEFYLPKFKKNNYD